MFDTSYYGYENVNIMAKDTLNVESGADTNIIGSKASGEKVNADVGENLNIESLQDRETEKWNKSSWGANGSIGLSGTVDGKGGFNFNASTNKMDSEYNSVSEQAGIYAGDRGFDINVEGNTDLKGAVIDSTAGYEDNTLNTGTLSFDDIDNKAEYESKGGTVGFDSGKSADKDENLSNRGLIVSPSMSSTGNADSTTHSTIADGTITIRNKDKQKQDINKLRRNTKNTLNKLDKIFDKDEIEEKQELAGVFAELAFTAVHQLSTDKDGNSRWTPTEKAMVHAAIGYLTSDLADSKTPISTALANGVNAYAVEAIKKDKNLKAYFDDNPALLRLVSIGIGAGIGGLTGDGNADAWSGASSAQNATRWNYQNYWKIEKDENGIEHKVGGHHSLNDEFANAVGFKEELKEEYVQIMNDVSDKWDKNLGTQVEGKNHSMPNKEWNDIVDTFSKYYSNALIFYEQGNENAMLEALGIANHILGDYRSHYLQGESAGWTEHIVPIVEKGLKTPISLFDVADILRPTESPDNPYKNQNTIKLFNDAKEASKRLGQLFKQHKILTKADIAKLFPKKVSK